MTLTVPLSEAAFWTLVFAGSVIALSVLVWWILLQRSNSYRLPRDWSIKALAAFASALTPIWAALIAFVLYALWRLVWAFPHSDEGAPGVSVLWGALRLEGSGGADDLRWHVLALVGLLTALAGLLGIPMALIRVTTTERQTRAAEEGLITERINTAVQGLGAEKKVDRIGRPVTVTQGATTDTRIEWQTQTLGLDNGETVTERGDWQVFSETLPNLEVRIGAIYALERIAQDSDRDHVQIMEILCAYIRENAPAKDAPPNPKMIWDAAWKRLEGDGADEGEIPHRIQTETGISPDMIEPNALASWGRARAKPRIDVQTAITVIGRRSLRQIALEAAAQSSTRRKDYRPDLRDTNLQLADLSDLDLRTALVSTSRCEGANLWGAQLQGASLWGAQLQGARLREAQLQGARLWGAQLQGARLREAQLQGADLWGAELQGADLGEAQLQGAVLSDAQLQGANLGEAQLQGAHLGEAQLQGADLTGAQFSDTTAFYPATLRGAGLKAVDLSMLALNADLFKDTFGDSDVTLPEGYPWPEDWRPKDAEPLQLFEFEPEWRAFQDRIGYVPDPAGRR
ncbi:pentapeptide repeat-containing protein [Pseudooceanicola pacificus]|nr:pentapeptide repeat-containing protein [Pseudooceanicola pacificus]